MQSTSQNYDLLLLFEEPPQKGSLEELLSFDTLLATPLLLAHTLNRVCSFSKVTLHSPQSSDAKSVFQAGMDFGRSYELMGSALIIGSMQKEELRKSELFIEELLLQEENIFEFLHAKSSKTLIFLAGFLVEASKRFEILLGGGVTLATALLIADKVRETILMRANSQNILFISSQESLEQEPCKRLFLTLSYEQKTAATNYDFSNSDAEVVNKIADLGDRWSAATPALFYYAHQRKISNETLLEEMELSFYLL